MLHICSSSFTSDSGYKHSSFIISFINWIRVDLEFYLDVTASHGVFVAFFPVVCWHLYALFTKSEILQLLISSKPELNIKMWHIFYIKVDWTALLFSLHYSVWQCVQVSVFCLGVGKTQHNTKLLIWIMRCGWRSETRLVKTLLEKKSFVHFSVFFYISWCCSCADNVLLFWLYSTD